MIYQHTHAWIFDVSPHTGEPKRLTSRLVKPGETLERYDPMYKDGLYVWNDITQRCVYSEGQSRAVQPARTAKAIGRITIEAIKRYDVRDISEAEARAEGFARSVDFLMIWCKMHDKQVVLPIIPDYETGLITWANMQDCLAARPAKHYDAWQLAICPEVIRRRG